MSRKSLIVGMVLIVLLFSGGFVLADFSAGDGAQTFSSDDLVAGVEEGESDPVTKTYPACWDDLTQCHGDSDNDGWVKGSDFLALKDSWYKCYGDSGYNPCADFDRDGCVKGNDFLTLKSNWYKAVESNCPPGDPNGIYPPLPADMVLIGGGEFLMGDHFNEGMSHELPVHLVKVDSFYMSRYEITNGQYCDFLNAADVKVVSGVVYASTDDSNSYPYCDTHNFDADSQIDYSGGVFSVRTKPEVGGRNMFNDPMVQVSWYGAVGYCNWRSQEEGYEQCYNPSTWQCDFSKKGYRLPTEAEWEYAARGGEHSPYYRFPWGDTISHSQANYNADPYTYTYDVSPTIGYHPDWYDRIYPYTSVVGSFSPNGYGLYDMAGNVCEWCNDWYDSGYYNVSPYDNPQGPASGMTHMLRGGNWFSWAYHVRVGSRGFTSSPFVRDYGFGFRVVLDN